MSNTPLVTVFIPAYNHERYVQETMRSIIAQTWQNIELIIIDDGSTDGTLSKIEELRAECEARFVRTLIISQPNRGLWFSSNRVLELAHGEYHFSLASDDAAAPHTIETELEFLEQHPDYVLAVGDNAIMNADSERIGWDAQRNCVPLEESQYQTFAQFLMQSRPDIDFHSEQFGSYAALVLGNHVPNGYLIRMAALRKMSPYTPEAPLTDHYRMLQLAKQGKLKFLNEVLYFYRWHGANSILQRERMAEFERKTFLYEQELVSREGMERWRELLETRFAQVVVKFRIGRFLRLYKETNLQERVSIKVLEIAGWRKVLKVKRW